MELQGLSQADLSRRSNLSRATISKLLNISNTPTPETCQRIAKGLGYSTDVILRAVGHLPEDELLSDSTNVNELAELMNRYIKANGEERRSILDYVRLHYTAKA